MVDAKNITADSEISRVIEQIVKQFHPRKIILFVALGSGFVF